jgi:Protein of unknown function (DUF3179)
MKKLFYIGLIGIALFEVMKVYFIMPFPGSQQMNSIDFAYFLHSYRWTIRIIFGLMTVAGFLSAFRIKHKWIPAIPLVIALVAIYYFNFKMTADSIFKEPANLTFEPKATNALNDSSIVVGVEHNGEVKAYPLRFIVYHHQVKDTVGGKPMLITYCSVCRTGRVFEPLVKGQPEKFRLVGMDHFNAMFEDATTKSWWRQVNGEAITGSLKGETLPEVESMQLTVGKLFELHPAALVMQLDEASKNKYDSAAKFERGKSKGDLTRTDSLSWKDKSWVVGIELNKVSKAYDWIELKEKRIINDQVGGTNIVLAIGADDQSFAAFERPADSLTFAIRNDTLLANDSAYNFSGRNLADPTQNLKRVKAYQEFWHSWRTFHPSTEQYKN